VRNKCLLFKSKRNKERKGEDTKERGGKEKKREKKGKEKKGNQREKGKIRPCDLRRPHFLIRPCLVFSKFQSFVFCVTFTWKGDTCPSAWKCQEGRAHRLLMESPLLLLARNV
jgi:hypothetical protein